MKNQRLIGGNGNRLPASATCPQTESDSEDCKAEEHSSVCAQQVTREQTGANGKAWRLGWT